MFEPETYLLRCAESPGSWGRLNRTLFSMLIDSTSRTTSACFGKSTVNPASNFVRPNQ